jgi:cytochrome d ubiquinol oxidase subunit II
MGGLAGWLLAFYLGGFALASTLFLSFSFFEYLAARRGMRVTHSFDFFTIFFALIFVLISIFLFLTLPVVAPHIAAALEESAAIPFFSGLSLLTFVLMMPSYKKYKGRRVALAITLFATVFFGIACAQLPYLIYPAVTLAGSFTDGATARAMFWVLGGGAVITVPSLFLLYYLFVYKHKKNDNVPQK